MFAIFSPAGFEEFIRAASGREVGQERSLEGGRQRGIEKEHAGDVIYMEP
jgi:hypothetical protein